MKSNTADVVTTSTGKSKALRTWTKPTATAAEVAKATLGAGGAASNSTDIQNCAS